MEISLYNGLQSCFIRSRCRNSFPFWTCSSWSISRRKTFTSSGSHNKPKNILGAFSFPIFGFLFKRYEIKELMNIKRIMALLGYGSALGTIFYDLYDRILIQDLFIGQIAKKNNKINYYLFSFAFFYIPTVVCFNDFGSSYLLEKIYSNLALNEAGTRPYPLPC